MQEKPDSTTGQSSTSRPKKSREPTQADSSGQNTSASIGAGASSSLAGAGASNTGITEQAKETVSKVASEAGVKVASRLNTQKDRAAEGLGTVAQALRRTTDQLREQNQGAAVHEYISSAADQVERLSGYLRSTNISEIVKGVEQFARRQPAVFIGSAFVLGLLGARFLKSSGSSANQSGSIPRSESLVSRNNDTGIPTYGQGDPALQGSGSSQYSLPSAATPVRGREE